MMTNHFLSTGKFPAFVLILTLLFTASCKKEGTIGDEQKEAFVKFYGTSQYDQGIDIKQTADGGFVILGNTTVGLDNIDISLLKTDEFGNLLWQRRFGGPGVDEGKGFQITADGGFIITGFTTNLDTTGEETDRDIVLIRTDPSGNMLWPAMRQFGSPDIDEEGRGIAITDDGYFIAAIADSLEPRSLLNYEIDLQAYRTDYDGMLNQNVVSGRVAGDDIVNKIVKIGQNIIYIGSTQSGNPNLTLPDVLMTVFNTSPQANDFSNAEYGRSLAGQAEKGIAGVEDNGELVMINDITLTNGTSIVEVVKTTVDLNTNIIQWVSTVEVNDIKLYGGSISKTNDGGFILAATGEAENGDLNIYLFKLSSTGSQQWEKSFGSSKENEQSEKVIQTTDNGYMILGTSGLEPNNNARLTNSLITLIKTTSNGELK